MPVVSSASQQRTASIVTGKGVAETARARAARGRLEQAGFTIAPSDAYHWQIDGFSYWPEVNMWRHPGGGLGGGGIPGLIDALKAAKTAGNPG